jgi:hypothetical protein
MEKTTIKQVMLPRIEKLADWCQWRNFAGSDPYDALNSPLLRILSLGLKPGRIFWTQLLRRSPVDLRPLLLVPPGMNPKGLGLFLGGYARMAATTSEHAKWQKGIQSLLDGLCECRSPGYHGNCWGYHFPWQSMAAFVPRATPTVVNTSFIGHALLDTWELLGNEQALALAHSTADFLLHDLNRHQEGDTFCFSYTPLDQNYVHNANLLGASLLARLGVLLSRDELLEPAKNALAYSMNHQHDDGAWFYAEADIQHWIDSFHTGFNLEALRWFLNLGLAPEYRENYEKGVRYYAEIFFGADYLPRYYHDRNYCVDIHAPTEAVCFFSGAGPEYRQLTEGVLGWMLQNMYDEKSGCFFYRRKGKRVIRTPHMRWAEAWGFRALTEYFYQLNRGENGNKTLSGA